MQNKPKNAKDIAGLFEFDFPKGKNDVPDLPFVKKIKVDVEVFEKNLKYL